MNLGPEREEAGPDGVEALDLRANALLSRRLARLGAGEGGPGGAERPGEAAADLGLELSAALPHSLDEVVLHT